MNDAHVSLDDIMNESERPEALKVRMKPTESFLLVQTIAYTLRDLRFHLTCSNRDQMIFSLLTPNERERVAQRVLRELRQNRKTSSMPSESVSTIEDELNDFIIDPSDEPHFRLRGNAHRRACRKILNAATVEELLKKQKSLGRKLLTYRGVRGRLREIQDFFRLTASDCQVLLFYYVIDVYPKAHSYFHCDQDLNDTIAHFDRIRNLIAVSSADLRDALLPEGRLGNTSLLKLEDPKNVGIDSHALRFLSGTLSGPLVRHLIEEVAPSVELALEDFPFPKRELALAQAILASSSGGSILLHGAPGTGKTELAKTLAKKLGRRAFVLTHGMNSTGVRRGALIAATRMLPQESSVLIVDEAEPILQTRDESVWRSPFSRVANTSDSGKPEKAWINQFLEKNRHAIIWIVNSVSEISEPVKRRFALSLSFDRLGEKQRLRCWQLQVGKKQVDFLSESDLETLARRYDVSPGGIALAIDTARGIFGKRRPGADMVSSTFHTLLSRHQQLTTATLPKRNFRPQGYSLDGLETDTSLSTLISSLTAFYERLDRSDGAETTVLNLNALFHGPPGTGKTELAHHIARELKRPLIVKRASDLISMWVGETEKNIRVAFTQAQQEKAILFLDEADSFFINRESAQRSWEVSQTNELLTQMESFNGVLICATNFLDHLDTASLRRFPWKVRFDYLKLSGKVSFFDRVLSHRCEGPLSPDQVTRLRQITSLTPGDFKVVFQKAALAPGQLPANLLLDWLETESRSKGARRPLGLGAVSS